MLLTRFSMVFYSSAEAKLLTRFSMAFILIEVSTTRIQKRMWFLEKVTGKNILSEYVNYNINK